ncbi:inositol monophosphatase 1-like isoform X2 [Amphibalanus amphitrite]|uniref:inositol monophosphatase 1-like isoform X2 n=1 Tax=Amphibalanus amphitrite TaxID=1232801 RepID=UPI001C911172|nr:inositol monophosphatase 1-like isoform X2 [Amphibalanus amphitrite]XP_043231250.1 inositol monophosphatase 1-like isoform X2 [Amphibalanus amphitrite]XP_043231251.1 inositol monophosphatase 1-like isoform X2 [Amphibalanus amphitrite]XP_043231252.1 inositol monophosphatase 1-like isoform X2 [Amphibalanus amphitrite]
MAEADLELCLSTALKLAREAGGMIKDAFKKKKNVMLKASPIDLVTETDEAVEKFLFSELRKVFPQHRYIGEESVAAGAKVDFTDAPTWIIDPVDGTMNFVHSFPFTCVSIGLTVNKEPVIGVIYNPILDHMYHARKGHGAFLNDEKITVSGETDLSKSLVIGEMGTSPIPEKRECVFENARILVGKAHGFRSLGSCALNMCLVASGAAELYHEAGIHCWDVAAGAVVVTEAGGVVIDTAGGEFDLLSRRVLCASSPSLGQEVASLLHQYQPPRD